MAPNTAQPVKSVLRSLSEAAVSHARATDKAGALMWRHIRSEFTNDPDVVAETLATDAPLAWSLPVLDDEDGNPIYFPGPSSAGLPQVWRYLVVTDRESIRNEYAKLRDWMDIKGWRSFWEIRSNWYVAYHGVGGAELRETGQMTRVETVAIFPVGGDGILGETHFSVVGADRTNRWPEVPASPGDVPDPVKRVEAMELQERFVDALRNEDVDGLLATHRDDSALLSRNYLVEESTPVNLAGADEIRQYYSELFGRYRIRSIEPVHKFVDTWYMFAELHWTVEERAGQRRVLEFCTTDLSPIDPDCKIWTRCGAGTDLIEVD